MRRERPALASLAACSAAKPVRVTVVFGGGAAIALRELLDGGLDGPTMPLLVEGLALAELRRRLGLS